MDEPNPNKEKKNSFQRELFEILISRIKLLMKDRYTILINTNLTHA